MERGFEGRSLELSLEIDVDDNGSVITSTGQRLEGCDGASPVSSSRYSSCGESEFERYCSANSVMGTPSLCSSTGGFQDSVESDLGSVKSLGAGDSDGLEGFSLGGRFAGSVVEDKGQGYSLPSGLGDWDCGNDVFDRLKEVDGHPSTGIKVGEGLVGFAGQSCFDDNFEFSSLEGVSREASGDQSMPELSNGVGAGKKGVECVYGLKSINGDSSNGELRSVLTAADVRTTEDNWCGGSHSNGFHFTHENMQFMLSSDGVLTQPMQETDNTDNERCRGEDEASSNYEHSEGQESMFNYDSDNENRPAGDCARGVHDRLGVGESENLILMNTSVAFGSNDWEDFEIETEEKAPASQLFFGFQESQGQRSAAKIYVGDVDSSSSIDCKLLDDQKQDRGSSYVSEVDEEIQGADKLSESLTSCSTTFDPLQLKDPAGQDLSNIYVVSDDETEEYLRGCTVYDIFVKQDILKNPTLPEMSSITMDGIPEEEHPSLSAEDASAGSDTVDSNAPFPMRDALEGLPTKAVSENKEVEFSRKKESNPVSSVYEMKERSISNDLNLTEDRGKVGSCEGNQFYDEVVNEMEEILLDSSESLVGRLNQNNNATFHSLQPSPLRDGGPTASTSGLNDGYPMIHQPLKIDGIEVVAAKQKRGDISLSERLVGVKEHTVYVIRVYVGKDQWEVERRYRDFYTLYRKLKSIFAQRGLILPSPWSSVEQESRKIFGNASPDVIAERSVLIQECLRSILQYKYKHHNSDLPSTSPLIWFLSPPKEDVLDSPNGLMHHQSTVAVDAENVSAFGKTIYLIVELRPYKSVKQILEIQRYTCAGCHRNFYDGTSRVQEFVQTFGWGKPRLCEYTGQLFCSSCHTNDMAVLPARVLHNWDFDEYPVSQLAKSYLDSILDQPMLCVSAVNPFLFSKVPALLHVVGIRKKIGAMLAYVHCPFRSTIYRGLRSRRYLLESNDFFALKDLIDLSKGAFAALPVVLDTVLKKIEEHITEQCLVCCDVGVPCGARQACDDPSSLIFPFQEEDAFERCESCESVFHKHCFERLLACPCGAHLKEDDNEANKSVKEPSLAQLLRKKSDSTAASKGLLSRLFSMGRQSKTDIGNDNVIVMGSLPL